MGTYDDTEESKYLMYFDVGNLYGLAITQYLPYGEFSRASENTDFNV